ncbi:hypothetical protein ACMHYO_14245 [Allopusillimonas ginsengisoli]|uniref:hypothetical protein n=1 Tax=Allopusillimonas ginsengisoli TaxID=453575 RepID=UPI0039C01285
MTDKQMKAAAIRQLRRQGKILPYEATMIIIATAILGKQPSNAPSLVVRNWLALNPEAPTDTPTAPIEPKARPEMMHVPHPRLAEINAGQPPMMTAKGIGNGIEGLHGYGRGS